MGLHGCNELCGLHPDLHWLQRSILEQEGWEADRREILIGKLEEILFALRTGVPKREEGE
jgi:hypothetical protein